MPDQPTPSPAPQALPIRRWRLFQFKCANSTLIVLFAGITSTLNGKDWSAMTATNHLISICTIATLVCRNFESLIDKSFSEGLASGSPSDTSGTSLFAKVSSVLMFLQIMGILGMICARFF